MAEQKKKIERVQTGVRIEKRILQVLKALAAKHEIGIGDLIEGIVLHSFEGKSPFEADSLAFVEQMRAAYGLDLTAADSHGLTED
jgi:predicted DNA-binding ribbon-helix-helix protein